MSELSSEVFKCVYIAAVSIGLWTCVSLVVAKAGNQQAHRYLAALVAVILVPVIYAYASLVGEDAPKLLITLLQRLTWLYGPLLFLFVRLLVNRPVSKPSAAMLFLPFIIAVLADPLLGMLQLGMVAASLLHISVYLSISAYTIYKARQQLKILYLEYAGTTLFWSLYIVAMLFAVVVYDAVLIIRAAMGMTIASFSWYIVVASLAAYVMTVALFMLLRPRGLEAAICVPETLSVRGSQSSENEEPTPALRDVTALSVPTPEGVNINTNVTPILRSATSTERKLELSTDIAVELERLLIEQMESKYLYKQNDLSLTRLADLVQMSSHHLSELLNVHMGTNFYQFINGYRLENALTLLQDAQLKLSVLDVAYESGFNNKNSFYKFFRENTGLTPSQYRKSQQQSAI